MQNVVVSQASASFDFIARAPLPRPAIVLSWTMAVDPLEEWLGKRLKQAYSVEDWVLEGVTSALLLLDDRSDAIDTIDNFLGDAVTPGAASAIVDELLKRKQRSNTPDASQPHQKHHQQVLPSVSQPGRGKATGSSVGSSQREKKNGKETSEKNTPASTASDPAHKPTTRTGSLKPSDLKKPVVNCLMCGKIFQIAPRDGVVSSETKSFLENKCKCTFCGSFVKVALTDGSKINSGMESSTASTASVRNSSREGTTTRTNISKESFCKESSDSAALEAKNRLVNFDRTAAARTTVIDDQADWYAVETNAWLDETEREEMKNQLIAQKEAEEDFKRHRASRVRIDLLGRRVEDVEINDGNGNNANASTTTGFMLRESSQGSLVHEGRTADTGMSNFAVAGGSIGANSQGNSSGASTSVDAYQISKNPTLAFAPHFQGTSDKKYAKQGKGGEKQSKTSSFSQGQRRRVQDESPFDAVAKAAGE